MREVPSDSDNNQEEGGLDMKKLGTLVALAFIASSPAIAQDKEIPLEDFIGELQKLPSESTVTFGEVFGTQPNGDAFYYSDGINIATMLPRFDPANACRFPPIDDQWVGSFWYVWCGSGNSVPDFEVQRDTYYSVGGRPPRYVASAYYDCQSSSDYAAMPANVRDALCR
jgi:hypothetical protein